MQSRNQWLTVHTLLSDLGFSPLYAKARKVVDRPSQNWPGTFRIVPYFKRFEQSGNVIITLIVHGDRMHNVVRVLLPMTDGAEVPSMSRLDRERTRLVDFVRTL